MVPLSTDARVDSFGRAMGKAALLWFPELTLPLLASLALSCTLGPNYQRPPIDSPAEFRVDQRLDASLARLEWFDVFQDPVLQQLIATALEGNKDLLAAAWRVDEARAQFGFVRSQMWPSLTIEALAERRRLGDGTSEVDPELNSYFARIGVSWELDLWGKFRRANESARAQLFAADWGRRALVVSLVAEVSRGYFLLRDLDKRLDVSRRTLQLRREATELVRERFEGGVVSELDVRQAEIEEATAAAAVPAFERQIGQVENGLSVLLGHNPGRITRGLELTQQKLPEQPPPGLPSELLQRRPDVLQSEQLLHAQFAQIGVAEALRWPSLSLTGFLGFSSRELSEFTSGGSWSIGVDLFGPLYQFGRNKRRVEVERARTEQAILAYEATVLDAFREVEDALIAIRTLRDQHEARTVQVAAAEDAQRLSRARYYGGVTNYLEVLDIERSLFQAELDASRTLQEHLSAIVDLYAALGGGWDPDEPFKLPASRISEDR